MQDRVYDQPSEVEVEEGVVVVDGPDAVAVLLTPHAAEETGHRLINAALEAQGRKLSRELRDPPPIAELDGQQVP